MSVYLFAVSVKDLCDIVRVENLDVMRWRVTDVRLLVVDAFNLAFAFAVPPLIAVLDVKLYAMIAGACFVHLPDNRSARRRSHVTHRL